MRHISLLLAVIILCIGLASTHAQSVDKVTMRLRVVCNYGPGGDIIIAVDLKKKAGGSYIGGYAVNFRYELAKMQFTQTQLRYNPNYWGFLTDYFDQNSQNLNRIVQQKANSPGNSLPMTSQYFSVTTNCDGDGLNDGFYELLRFVLKIKGSAQGTANFVFDNWLAYLSGGGTPGSYDTFVWNAFLNDNVNDVAEELFNIVVPVELVLFEGTPLPDGKVRLDWRTVSESSNFGFEVQRLTGESWKKVGFVHGRGNSSVPTDYSYIDSPFALTGGNDAFRDGTMQYRLKQIDTDGTESYSPIVGVEMLPGYFSIGSQYPNPAVIGSIVSIPYQIPVRSAIDMQIYNSLGQKVTELASNRIAESGYHTVIWNTASAGNKVLEPGVYFCRFSASLENGESIRKTARIVLMR